MTVEEAAATFLQKVARPPAVQSLAVAAAVSKITALDGVCVCEREGERGRGRERERERETPTPPRPAAGLG